MTHILKLQRLSRHNPTFGALAFSTLSNMCPLGPDGTGQPFQME